MLINEFSKPVTVKSINENLAKKYGKTINVDKFTTEQLEDARNRLRTTLSQVETNESFDAVHTSETYQKNKKYHYLKLHHYLILLFLLDKNMSN